MSWIDWLVLSGTLIFIVAYGTYKTRGAQGVEDYLKGGNSSKWWTIGLSVMATQASAITFLSTPGQAYADGMRFVQFYLGLPIAMIVLSITFIPIFYRLKVYTAYEFLETRFDAKTRSLAAFLFLLQRGLAAGITIYAPAIILSTLLSIPLSITTLIIGLLVIIYTVIGGTKAVSQTQQQQMAVMMGGMIIAGVMVVFLLPEDISFNDALKVAGKSGKLNAIDFSFDLEDRYNIWSGIFGAFFLFMAYFGTDQSQVQRYISGKSIRESRLGLMMNGLLKVPMQFLILFVGVLVFVFYQFNQPPVFFNEVAIQEITEKEGPEYFEKINNEYSEIHKEKSEAYRDMLSYMESGDDLSAEKSAKLVSELSAKEEVIREDVKQYISEKSPLVETNDKDYIFMTFVMDHLPKGLVGLLFAVIFSAAMSSTSSELNALGSTATIDFYKRYFKKDGTSRHYMLAGKVLTFVWGAIAMIFAFNASLLENLIQLVNLLGSLFYGAILGIFITAFYVRYVKGTAVFVGALIGETLVIVTHLLNTNGIFKIGFLWYNLIGCVSVVVFSLVIQALITRIK
ncbi:sodium:solute symporter [Marinigracilibium pacificum]|uniref:Sodium:solute symporter n=1 Tax=Marinigracilibium pacificum TaxID=2729599 RepID=A0A848J249_9BACT|nr:sodium:solute symporter [Marinigracilibium pacificum]NMM48389.1 sodium:solute symporter [Marinigracilibium pacificum]